MGEFRFTALPSNYNLPKSSIYLVPVMPLVGAMWANDSNQFKEQLMVRSTICGLFMALEQQSGA